MALFLLGVIVFWCWMLVDCLTHPVRDKIFWAALILGTFGLGAVIYATQRGRLLGEMPQYNLVQGVSYNTQNDVPPPQQSVSSQLIKGIGMTIGVIFAVGGMLFVGFFVLLFFAFSSYGSSK